MPDDKKLDLGAELSDLKNAFLNDVGTAAEEVKTQLKAAADSEKKKAQAAKSKQLSAIIVGVSAVVLVLIAYWVVFARPDSNAQDQAKSKYANQPKVRIVTPVPPSTQNKPAPPNTQTPAPVKPQNDSQVVDRPSDEYEQPGQDSGM
jgi:hypothetical protein